jgi:hypothetical protein
MVAWLPYTHTIWYHTPTSTSYPLERGGTKIKKFVGREFTHLRETANKPNLTRIFSFKLSFSLFYYCNLLGFLTTTRITCMAESSLWTRYLEASVEDMLI